MKPYPRANISEGDGVTLSADLYNRMVDDLERLDRLAVMPPLAMTSGGAGSTISMAAPAKETVLVTIIGTETGGGRYQGSILFGPSTGNTSTNFQLQGDATQSQTDGPKAQINTAGTAYVNNALVVNVPEQYVVGSHLLANNTSLYYYAVGKVMGQTNEATPRTIVYIDAWPVRPVLAKITAILPDNPVPGVYTGRIVESQFSNGSNFAENYDLSTLGSQFTPLDNCWITNVWEQTNIGGEGHALAVGTYVWGFFTGFPVSSIVDGARSADWFYQVHTWFPPMSATLTYQPTALTTSETAGTTYTSNEKNMLNAMKTDVVNLWNTVNNLYANLKAAGYSLCGRAGGGGR